MAKYVNADALASWRKMLSLKGSVCIKKELDEKRVKNYEAAMAEGLRYNYAAKEVNEEVLGVLENLSREACLIEKYRETLSGSVMNTGEKRSVLHHLLRGELMGKVEVDGVNKREEYVNEAKRVSDFACAVHEGKITNEKGEKFTDVCQIGIGGSDLGPRAVYLALLEWARRNGKENMKAHFISNVDPDDAAAVISRLDLSRTLFVLVSKSGTTLETLTNEEFVKDFIKKAGLDSSRHMIAVTSSTSPLANNSAYLSSFYMDDYIGGRYSVSSPVGGVILSLAFTGEVFHEFLAGAAASDKAALNENFRENAAMLDALIGVWERNALGYPMTAVLPYSQALLRFPAHLQQLDMESNGKSVNRDGGKIDYESGPILFGEPGTNGQHSFYQLLHQGTTRVPLQFIAFKKGQTGKDITVKGTTSQTKLNANVAAQIVAFADGKEDDNPNKSFQGGRASSIIYGDELTPRTMGALLAHFENKVMFQGFVWNINSFDQEGVQLGKKLATAVLEGNMSGLLKAYAGMLL